MKNWKDNVHFVLVEPREPGNIGAAARAIKNMGFRNLSLVNPPSNLDNANVLARNAVDVLNLSRTFGSFADAMSDKELVAGTTRRSGRKRGAFIPLEDGVSRLFRDAHDNRVAIVFGREDKGLYNEEIDECGFLMTIPASRSQPSVNLSHAVQIIAYELAKAGLEAGKSGDLTASAGPRFVAQKELELLYRRMENAFKLIEYIPPGNEYLNKKIMQKMKHFLGRAGLIEWEYNMFHGICDHIERLVKKERV